MTPGHWKMMLAYRSHLHQSSYYVAFEDWEGANQETWFGNDGDFNDKVFRVTGVSCPGGGEPCDTGKQGACAAGLTACSLSAAAECKQQYPERDEECDNLDNDCDGQVDDGELCPSGQVCAQGLCVRKCSTGEFRCPAGFACRDDGFCVAEACVDIECGPGRACRDGECVGECQAVVCPLGQVCQLDRCVDPCAGVTCEPGSLCDRGVCVGDCTCSGCPSDRVCAPSGLCVAPGCERVSCSAGQGCRDGRCVGVCDGAVCPSAAECANGTCAEPLPSSQGGVSGNGGAATGGISVAPTGGANPAVPSSPGAGGATTGGSGSPQLKQRGSAEAPGCGCRLGAATSAHWGLASLAALAGFLTRRRARTAPGAGWLPFRG